MADLPELPDRIRRLHALRWNELIEGRGFAGDHLKWRYSPERRRGPMRLRLAPPPPCADIHSNAPVSKVTYFSKSGEETAYQQWREEQLAERRAGEPAWLAARNESIGIAQTVEEHGSKASLPITYPCGRGKRGFRRVRWLVGRYQRVGCARASWPLGGRTARGMV